jgi:probable rRNA maturation factor
MGGEGQPEVFVADEQSQVAVDAARWGALAEAVLLAEGVRGGAELSLLFVDEPSIAELNERFMEHEGPTDVLAFPIDADAVWAVHDPLASGPNRADPDPDEIPLLLGDVVVCPAGRAQRSGPRRHARRRDRVARRARGAARARAAIADPEDAAEMRLGSEPCSKSTTGWPAPAGFRQEQSTPPPSSRLPTLRPDRGRRADLDRRYIAMAETALTRMG